MTATKLGIKTAVYAPAIGSDIKSWSEKLRRMDESGLTAISVSDHFLVSSQDPLPTLAAIAMVTEQIRIMALVLCNDYRHPVITHKAAATIDVLSGGRLDLGLGAGYLRDEYHAAGISYDNAGTRVDRFEESVGILRSLFAPDPVNHNGTHYTINGLTGSPVTDQSPHPPFIIGGGGRRMLSIAGRYADIAGIHSNLNHGVAYDASVIEDMLPANMARKIDWVRRAAESVNRDPDVIDLLSITWTCRIVDHPSQTEAAVAETCARYGVSKDIGRQSTGLLIGTVEECLYQLLERKQNLGLNYVDFGAADFDEISPLLDAIAETRLDVALPEPRKQSLRPM